MKTINLVRLNSSIRLSKAFNTIQSHEIRPSDSVKITFDKTLRGIVFDCELGKVFVPMEGIKQINFE